MSYIIEVGINRGTDTVKLLKKYPKARYIGFEPVPELHKNLLSKYETNPRVEEIYQAAVSKTAGEATFNITATDPKIKAKWGASSLFQFDDKLSEKWDRADFKTESEITVEVMTLADVIENHNINEIEFLHCDAQGSDLDVLKGLGKYANIVKAGVVEATDKIALYKNCDNTIEKVTGWLNSNGFGIDKITSNDPKQAEVNVYFSR